MSNGQEREKEIGRRLRAFRESKLIPRTRMAVVLGIGNERLASYESGRAPLPYDVFRRLAQHFQINPYWLNTGDTQPTGITFDDSSLVKILPPRARFTEVYDGFLKPSVEFAISEAGKRAEEVGAGVRAAVNMTKEQWEQLPMEARKEFFDSVEKLLGFIALKIGEKASVVRAEKVLTKKRKTIRG